jgi:hypothetical protein
MADSLDIFDLAKSPERLMKFNSKMMNASFNIARSKLFFWMGMMRYASSFITPYWTAVNNFSEAEMSQAGKGSPLQTAHDLVDLLLFEMKIASKGTMASISALNEYHTRELREVLTAIGNSLCGSETEDEDILQYSERQLKIMDAVNSAFPRAIEEIATEFGLHFDNGGYIKTAETERFELYQVLPLDKGVQVREHGKPMIVVPPYVLGANILAFLPGENRSYVHAFANSGIPTYIRVVKNIDEHHAVQVMTGDDDARDMRYFSEQLVAKHGKKVTLNGYCQGGFMSTIDILSGQLDGLVDALITCVAPLDGSRSNSLVEYIEHLPFRFRDLGYALKKLPNGNRVVDGRILSWVFKLKSIENEAPFLSFYRDLMMFNNGSEKMPRISKVAAAISHWLTHDITDIPVGITRLSFDSYTKPVSEDGTLPVRLFGKPLNFNYMREKGIKWLICVAQGDDLVDESAALAPLDFVDAEVAVFPKGHASIATSWSSPASECSLDTKDTSECRLKSNYKFKPVQGKSRGPLRFQLDLEEETKEEPRAFDDAIERKWD